MMSVSQCFAKYCLKLEILDTKDLGKERLHDTELHNTLAACLNNPGG